MADEKNPKTEFEREAEAPQQGLLAEFLHFLLNNKKWWLTPIILVLLLVTLAVLVLAMLTVSFHSYRAATANPAESLKTE